MSQGSRKVGLGAVGIEGVSQAHWTLSVPALYEAALLNTGMHLLMYALLLVVSLMFWHTVLESRRVPGGALPGAARPRW